jgi:hypothetical protein
MFAALLLLLLPLPPLPPFPPFPLPVSTRDSMILSFVVPLRRETRRPVYVACTVVPADNAISPMRVIMGFPKALLPVSFFIFLGMLALVDDGRNAFS